MKRTGRKTLCMVLTLLLALPTLAGLTAVAEGPGGSSGVCGDGLTYTLTDHVLTIIGTGDMYDFSYFNPTSENTEMNPPPAPWMGVDGITSVVLGDGVTNIGQYAFCNLQSLSSVTIPDSVTRIHFGAFEGCSILMRIDIPESVKYIGGCVFDRCFSLSEISLPQGLEYIYYDPFKDTPWYEAQPDGMIYIGKVAYCYKGDMPENTHITLPEGTTCIAGGAFDRSGLTSIDIPQSVRWIGPYAFDECNNLSAITFPDGLTEIAAGVCRDCYSITSIDIPDGVTRVGGGAFWGSSLKKIYIPESVTTIDHHAFDCVTLEEIKVSPDNPSYHSFENCLIETSTKTLIQGCRNSLVPADGSVTSFCEGAFGHQPITSIIIPACVTSPALSSKLGTYTFIGCNALTDVYFVGNEEQWNALVETDDKEELYNFSVFNATLHYAEYFETTEPTATEHGFTDGVYCADTDAWLYGHKIIHNTLGEMTVLREPTEDEPGECRIVCSVCGESGLYAMDPVTEDPDEPTEPTDPAGPEEDNSFIGRIKRTMQSIINFFLRILRWLGGKK